jgi:signal transduction histidine kinase
MLSEKNNKTELLHNSGSADSFMDYLIDSSSLFPGLVSPAKLMSSFFPGKRKAKKNFNISFIYRLPQTGIHYHIKNRENLKGDPIDHENISSLQKSRITESPVALKKKESQKLEIDPSFKVFAYPISNMNQYYGFLLLHIQTAKRSMTEEETAKVKILAQMIANGFQNFALFERLRGVSPADKALSSDQLESFESSGQREDTKRHLIEFQKSEVLKEILPVIFHKLKNKLTPILGYSQILLSKVQDEALTERIQRIEKNAEELSGQLNQLRGYFSTEARIKQKENLSSIIHNLKPFFEEIEKNTNIKIKVFLDYKISEDLLIPGQLKFLVTNLVENSVLAIQEKGHRDGVITVQTRQEKDDYRLIIRDDGIGIPSSEFPKIWTPFYSLFPDRAGLGLTVCEKIISNHDARHQISSITGQYTEMQVIFESHLQSPSYDGGLRVPNQKTEGHSILIMHQEEYMVDLMKEILQTAGEFDTTTSTNGQEAIELINKQHFNLIISDIAMPGVDGREIFHILKSLKRENTLLLTTPDTLTREDEQFIKSNKVKHLQQPFELMVFRKKVLERLSLKSKI